jgi:phosphoglycolate phosphatase
LQRNANDETPQLIIDAICFDLDGTLVDTAPCIVAALNQALAEEGLTALSTRAVTTLIGGGPRMLIERALRALGVAHDAQRVAALLARYQHNYLQPSEPTPQAFDGVAEALAELRRMGLRHAVVTNTLDRFARTILRRCGLDGWIDVVVSADTLAERKPDPAPLRFACRALAVEPSRALFVGDSINDSEAATAAGITMVCMSYGYNEGQPVRELRAAAVLDSMRELVPWVRDRHGRDA